MPRAKRTGTSFRKGTHETTGFLKLPLLLNYPLNSPFQGGWGIKRKQILRVLFSDHVEHLSVILSVKYLSRLGPWNTCVTLRQKMIPAPNSSLEGYHQRPNNFFHANTSKTVQLRGESTYAK